jgi:hypothetical protein
MNGSLVFFLASIHLAARVPRGLVTMSGESMLKLTGHFDDVSGG